MLDFPRFLVNALERSGRGLTIVVIRLGAMGDILRTLPPVHALRRALGEARLIWVVEDQWKALLEGYPDLDGVLPVPRRLWQRSLRSPAAWPRAVRSLMGFRRDLKRVRPDLAIDFHGNLRSGVMAWMSRAPVRVGHRGHQQREGNRWLTTHHVDSGERRTSRVERNFDLVRGLGIRDATGIDLRMPLVDAGEPAACEIRADLEGSASGYAVIAPGASAAQSYKRPPPELLAAAAGRLARNNVKSLVVYGPNEKTQAEAVVERAGGSAILAPPTELATLAALLSRAKMLVVGDSGPLHMACAVGCPVVGVYGPTDPIVNQPWGVPFRTVLPPDRHYTGVKRIDRQSGFEGITTSQVESAIEDLLGQLSSPAEAV